MNKKKILKDIKYSLRFLPDTTYIQLYYLIKFHRFCNLKNPVTYNEKLNWLKLHDRNPKYQKMVDKYEAKKYAAQIIGDEYIIPTIGVWKKFDDIDFDQLPDQFVLKCTHDSEGLVICTDKKRLNTAQARRKINTAMKYNFYYIGREWPYRQIVPRIIAEPYIEDKRAGELRDYKFFCFDGEPKFLFVATGRSIGKTKFDYYNLSFEHQDLIQHYPNSDQSISKPKTYEQMITFARMLSNGIPHVRVDFYEADEKLYFGELTFYHFSGFMPFWPEEWDYRFGEWINLRGISKS